MAGRSTLGAAGWADGPYEVRFTTSTTAGKTWTTHLPWFKGDARAAAAAVVETAKGVDVKTPAGKTRRMLADLVLDRAGGDLAKAGPEALRRTQAARLRVRRSSISRRRGRRAGSTATASYASPGWTRWTAPPSSAAPICRPGMGRTGAGPSSSSSTATTARTPSTSAGGRWTTGITPIQSLDRGAGGPVYIEPHGRGNTQYRGFGEKDVLRAIAETKKALSIDEDRVYLTGDSMGGWGTWQVATRNPEVFAAIAPIYGGADYRAQLGGGPREADAGRALPPGDGAAPGPRRRVPQRADPRLARRLRQVR